MKRGDKKNVSGQTTVFIIVGVIIFILIVLFMYFRSLDPNKNPISNLFKSEIQQIQSGMEQCSREVSRDAVKRIGIQGGYYNKPDYSDDLGWAFIPYYYYNGNYLMPNISVVESELGSYVSDRIGPCLQSVTSFGYEITYPQPITKTSLSKGKVKFVIDLPITIKKGDSAVIQELKNNEVIFNSSIYEIFEVADYITKTHRENESMFCVNCVVEMAKERQLYVDFIDYKDTTTLVMLSENHTYQEPYLFEFLNKYPN